MMAGLSSVSLLGLIAAFTVAYLVFRRGRNGGDAPKPLKLPVIGDLHSSPLERPLLNWDAWSKAKGPVAVAKLFGVVPIVVLNTAGAATELFGKRSANYSNRPGSVTMEMITHAEPGKCKMTLMHDYDAELKLHHRMLAPSLGAVAAPRYQPLMEVETKQLLHDLLKMLRANGGQGSVASSPGVYELLERTQASIILALHYGFRIQSHSDPILHEIMDIQAKVTYKVANPVLPDIIPPLRHLPALVSPWRRAADEMYGVQVELYTRLMETGRNAPGWNATKQAQVTSAKHAGPRDIPDVDMAFSLSTSVIGGIETSPRQTMWLFVAALAYPGFMARAHELLDAVVGRDRLPSFADRTSLPYIEAVVSELMRWRPVVPGSIPRRAEKEDEYQGTRIRKGVTLFANSWAIGRDVEVFDDEQGDLQDFVPERWLEDHSMDEDVRAQGRLRLDLPMSVFGQGRRSCPGKRVAIDGTWIIITTLLWAFDVQPLEDVDSMAMRVAGFMTMPAPFQFVLKPRGPWALDVLEREWSAAEKDLGKVMGDYKDVEA